MAPTYPTAIISDVTLLRFMIVWDWPTSVTTSIELWPSTKLTTNCNRSTTLQRPALVAFIATHALRSPDTEP